MKLLRFTLSAYLLLLTPFAVEAQAATHSVQLNWTDNINPATTTWSVYRSTSACPMSAYNKLVTVNVKTYTDTAVSAGATYCYVVRAVYQGSESTDSNTAQALVPVDAVPPTGLTVTIK